MTTFCHASLQYAGREGPLVGSDVRVEIHNARIAHLPGWEACGFELLRHTPSVRDWTNDDEIASVHYGEVEELARRLTGCDAALVSDHVKRSAEHARREREQSPVRLVHSDFAADYEDVIRYAYRDVRGRGAATLARAGVSAGDIENASRIVMMQFWRNIGLAKMDYPVAFCDARTVTPDEARPFHYTGYVAGGRAFDALAIMAPSSPAEHAWYTFPEMASDEVVAFRTYDTDLVREGRTWFTPHTAFHDPEVALGNPARFSIEMRVMCVFR